MKRYIEPFVLQDLKKKMVFIGGPRQVGKTILSKSICHDYKESRYLNLDLDSLFMLISVKQIAGVLSVFCESFVKMCEILRISERFSCCHYLLMHCASV